MVDFMIHCLHANLSVFIRDTFLSVALLQCPLSRPIYMHYFMICFYGPIFCIESKMAYAPINYFRQTVISMSGRTAYVGCPSAHGPIIIRHGWWFACHLTRSPAVAEGPRDAGVPVEMSMSIVDL